MLDIHLDDAKTHCKEFYQEYGQLPVTNSYWVKERESALGVVLYLCARVPEQKSEANALRVLVVKIAKAIHKRNRYWILSRSDARQAQRLQSSSSDSVVRASFGQASLCVGSIFFCKLEFYAPS